MCISQTKFFNGALHGSQGSAVAVLYPPSSRSAWGVMRGAVRLMSVELWSFCLAGRNWRDGFYHMIDLISLLLAEHVGLGIGMLCYSYA